ncbi:hypothetical protein ABFX02_09G056300 [Erythranthe guttata]
MLREKFSPRTFLGALSACSHSGLLDKGCEIFDEMNRKDSLISPKLEHYSCYIDLLARSGYICSELIFYLTKSGHPPQYKARTSSACSPRLHCK